MPEVVPGSGTDHSSTGPALRTGSAGTFSTRVRVAKSGWYVATASIPQRTLPAAQYCKPTFGVPCVSATIGASRVESKGVKVAR